MYLGIGGVNEVAINEVNRKMNLFNVINSNFWFTCEFRCTSAPHFLISLTLGEFRCTSAPH